MPRKLEENIFADIGRQVHAIADDGRGIFSFQRQVTYPVPDHQRVLKRLEAAHALAIERQPQLAPKQQALVEVLRLDIIAQRLRHSDHFVPRINVQFLRGQFALKREIMRLQMVQIHDECHDVFQAAYCLANFAESSARTYVGTNALTSPPNRAISFTMRELRKVYVSFGIIKIVSIRSFNLRFINAS